VNKELLLVQSNKTWTDVFTMEKRKPYFKKIVDFLAAENKAGTVIYPNSSDLFSAFKETPYEQVKVVILGQDPYHGPGQAHGLAFSVTRGVKPPPSLMNIFKELALDLNTPTPPHGCLTSWANQGVLLLNTSLSVEQGKPQSHALIGWAHFTDNVIKELNKHQDPLVFLLWGAHAKSKAPFIKSKQHLILTAAHPSPLSAHRGFLGCRHFSQTNAFLIEQGRTPIDWAITA